MQRCLAWPLTGGEQVLGQHLCQESVVAFAFGCSGGLVDHPRAARSPRGVVAPYGVPGVHEQVEMGPNGVLVQPDVVGDLAHTERLGARSKQLEDRRPTGAGRDLVLAPTGAAGRTGGRCGAARYR
jgi:hypothetical protein